MNLDCIHKDDRGDINVITGDLTSCPEITIFKTGGGKARGGCIHRKSKEHLVVIEGVIKYVYGELHEHVLLKPGQSITIDPSVPHFFLSITDSIVAEWGPQLDEKVEKYKPFRDIVEDINNQ